MTSPVCPYCGDSLVGTSASRDHVFMDALGATATVLACRQCNSTLGHTVEASLLEHNQLLNLGRLANGAGGKRIRGTLPDGRRMTSDLRSPVLESQRPVQSHGDNLMVSGSAEQVRAQLARMGATSQLIEEAMAGATVEQLGEQMFSFTLVLDIRSWARFTAKAALGSGYAAAPEWFTDTEVARSLQDICHGRIPEYASMASADMELYKQAIEESVKPIIPGYKIDPLTTPEHHQMVFVPYEDHTSCIASLGRAEYFGIVAPGSIRGWTTMPVVISDDNAGSFTVRYVEHEVRTALAGRGRDG